MKMIVFTILIVVTIAAAILFGIGWYYSEMLKREAFVTNIEPPEYNLLVKSANSTSIELISKDDNSEELFEEGHYKIEWADGFGFTKSILQSNENQILRDYSGKDFPLIGEPVRLETFFYSGNPNTALNIDYEEVPLNCELGICPAWKVEGDRENWVIVVHGKGSNREESLRILETLKKTDTSILVITYRNDPETNPSENGYYGFGQEWPDLEIAVEYALQQGAKKIILYGFSMGGAISLGFLQESTHSSNVVGLILDAPVISFNSLVNHGIAERNVPKFIGEIGKWVATQRFKIPWDKMDYFKTATELEIPVLIFHGTKDKLTPVKESEKIAQENDKNVTLVTTNGVGHAKMWNYNPKFYEEKVFKFLSQLIN